MEGSNGDNGDEGREKRGMEREVMMERKEGDEGKDEMREALSPSFPP